jgi:tetratricopeptide (TPR) repeat protein
MTWLNHVRRLAASSLFVCSFLILPSFGVSVAAQQAADPEMEQGLHLLEEGRTTLDDSVLTQARDFFTKLTQQHPDNAVYFYELARVNFYHCESYVTHGDKKKGEKALDTAIENAQQSLKLNEKSADTHSLLGDLYGRKISFGMGMIAGPKYGPKAQAENKRALELDANNPRVFASWGREYLNAPKMFGGDLDKAIESFRKSTQLDPNFDETFVWLGIALRKKGDAAGADQALQQALKLNPRSVFAQQTAAKK